MNPHDAILAAVASGPMWCPDIAAAIGCHQRQTLRYLSALVDYGKLQRRKTRVNGQYRMLFQIAERVPVKYWPKMSATTYIFAHPTGSRPQDLHGVER